MNQAVKIFYEMSDETARQYEKWGDQRHPDGTGLHYPFRAAQAKIDCEAARALGELTWRDILIEEVYEALAETDPAKLRAELVQVAAVCATWIYDIDRREA